MEFRKLGTLIELTFTLESHVRIVIDLIYYMNMHLIYFVHTHIHDI